MKKFIWAALAVSFFSVSSYAQQAPRADISAGYSFLRVGGTGGANLNGFNSSVAYNVNDWLGIAGDIGVYHASPAGVSVTAISYTFGPRFTYRKSDHFMPFAEALFGASHASAAGAGFSGSGNAFTYALGGGAELPLGSSHSWALRPEAEYVGLRPSGVSQVNCVRISVGIVYHIGQK